MGSAGLYPEQKISLGLGYQAHFTKAVKEAVGDRVVVSVVRNITRGKQTQDLLDAGVVDVVISRRYFMKSPGLVWAWAEELDVAIHVVAQIGWAFGGREGGGLRRLCCRWVYVTLRSVRGIL